MAISAEDHIEITRLMYRYARCADTKDYSGFAEVFCADAQFVYRGELISPLSEITAMLRTLDNYPRTQHRVSNVLYEVEGDVAIGETYTLATHIALQDGKETKIDMAVVYQDVLQREQAGWRIKRREFDTLWTHTVELVAS